MHERRHRNVINREFSGPDVGRFLRACDVVIDVAGDDQSCAIDVGCINAGDR
jgi:hypothetical protein